MIIERIVSPLRGGSSLPVLAVTSSGAKCVIKWKGTGEGPHSNGVDWISLHLARLAGIRVPTPHLISVTPDLAQRDMDPDITDLIERSLGLNLGIEYLPNSTPYRPQLADSLPAELRQRIYQFDALLLNIDRTDLNPNMIVSGNELYCIDFAAAMSIRMLLNGQRVPEQVLLSMVRRHPFYSRRDSIALMSPAITGKSVEEIVGSMPDEWLDGSVRTRKQLIDGIVDIVVAARTILARRLMALDETPIESAEDMKERTLRNRREFERKWLK